MISVHFVHLTLPDLIQILGCFFEGGADSDVILTMCIMLSENNLLLHNSQNTDLSTRYKEIYWGKHLD